MRRAAARAAMQAADELRASLGGRLEPLEQRRMLASISGIVWNDRNGDGVRNVIDATTGELEPALSGRTIYIDTNDNGVLDGGEPSRVSNASGAYSFNSLPGGTYVVRQVVPNGWRAGVVGAGDTSRRVTVAVSDTLSGAHLGSYVEVMRQRQTLQPAAPQPSFADRIDAIAVDGSYAVVGAYQATEGSIASGAAYLFRKVNDVWVLEQTLLASDRVAGDRFGNSVAIRGDLLVVGAPGRADRGTNAGAVYVFRRSGPSGEWVQSEKVVPSVLSAGDEFGLRVSLDQDRMIATAHGDDQQGLDAGAVYSLEYDGVSYAVDQKILRTSGPFVASDQFGVMGVDIHGDTMAISGAFTDVGGTNSGAVFVYQRDGTGTWMPHQVVLAPATHAYMGFGASIAIDSQWLVIGADPYEPFTSDVPSNSRDAAYVYRRNLQSGQFELVNSFPPATRETQADKYFNVDLANGRVVFGVPAASTYGATSGYAGLYAANGGDAWTSIAAPSPSTIGAGSQFGRDIAMAGDDVLIGASGAVFAYSISPAAYIRGTTWNDRDADGVRDADEPTLAGRTVYLDADEDGLLDAGETSLVSDANGNYEFQNLAPGDYVVRQVVPAGWRSAGSPSVRQTVSVAAGTTSTGMVFGSIPELWTLRSKVTAGDGAAGDLFGYETLSVLGDTAFIGAYGSDAQGSDSGAVYAFERSATGQWTQSQRLTATGGVAGDGFGGWINFNRSSVLVAATNVDLQGADSGAAYVFERDGGGQWVQSVRLSPADAQAGDYVGVGIIIGDLALVSAQADDDLGTDSGSVTVFERDTNGTWSPIQKFYAGDGQAGDYFGWPMITDGQTLLVGAHTDDDQGTDSGSVYVFERNAFGQWVQIQKILGSDVGGGDHFGRRISLDGDMLVVGADYHDALGSNSGGAYVFARNSQGQWVQQQKLTAPDGGAGKFFGGRVALKGDVLAISSLFDGNGSTWLFSRTGGSQLWTASTKITAPDGASGDDFGSEISFDGTTLLIGAGGDDDRGSSSGSAYFYELVSPAYLTGTAFHDANNNATKDAGETPIAGRTIFLDADADGVLDAGEASTTTNAAGQYFFDDLVPGTYRVTLVQLNETSQSLPTLGGAHVVTLGSGQTSTNDFGIVNAATIVSGITWNDRNADGIRQADVEPLLSGRTVYWDKNDNGVLDGGESSVLSDANGAWSIRNVLPGQRVFRQAVPSEPWANVSPVSREGSYALVVPAGAELPGLGFGSAIQLAYNKISSADGALDTQFGRATAISGNFAVVGAPTDDTLAMDSGSVYIFERASGSPWSQVQKIVAFDGAEADRFGEHVAMFGDVLAVGSPQDDDQGANSGSVYLYRRGAGGTWAFTAKLAGSGNSAGDTFGRGLAMNGDTLVVSASVDAPTLSGQGTAYVFRKDAEGNWSQQSRLVASDPSEGALFGGDDSDSVALDGQSILIGAYGARAAYVFEKSGGNSYVQTAKLTPIEGGAGDYFGFSVAILGDVAVVGAIGANNGGSGSGAAYIYKRGSNGTWAYQQKLTSSAPSNTWYSYGLGLTSQHLYIGPKDGTVDQYDFDSATLFNGRRAIGTGQQPGDDYGFDIAVSGEDVLVGARNADSLRGAAYVFPVVTSFVSYLRGTAFQDVDNDGIRDVGEAPLANWNVYLDLNDNGTREGNEPELTTDANGFYEFQDLAPGSYVVRQVRQALWTQTLPASDQPYRVTLAPGQTYTGDIGNYASATVAGRLFADANGNGVQDAGDEPLVGWVLFNDLDDDRQLDPGERTAITDANGDYELSDLPVRAQKIDVVTGAAWGIAPYAAALNQSLVFSGVRFASQPAHGQSFPSTGTLQGDVIVDTDGSGTVDPFETEAIANVVFNVYRDDGDGAFEPGLGDVAQGTVTTDAQGRFTSAGRAIGTYWLQVSEASLTSAGVSLYGRPAALRAVVAAQRPASDVDFSVLKAYTVTTLADEIPGSNTPGALSLREALDLVRTDGRDTGVIVFAPSLAGGVIQLDAADGQLLVRDNVSVIAPGSGIVVRSAGNSRVFSVSAGVTLDLDGVTLSGGLADRGGAVFLSGGATLNAVRTSLRDNVATKLGGAVYLTASASATFRDSVLQDNAAANRGGAIWIGTDAVATIERSTLSGNRTTAGGSFGGAVYSAGTLSLVNATLADNSAASAGGAVYAAAGSATLLQATIAGNRVTATSGSGGGLFVASGVVAATQNSIVATNVRVASTADDVAGSVDPASRHNIIGAGATGLTNGVNGNQLGTVGAPLDPMLMPLDRYGGTVPVMPLRFGSPAIDAGDDALSASLATDSAGNARRRDFDSNGASTVDLGAYEDAPLITVDALLDESTDTDSLTSLREAIAGANARPGFDLVRFASSLGASEIVVPLSLGELSVTSALHVQGLEGRKVIVDAQNASRAFALTNSADAVFSELTIRGGAEVDGGGIHNAGRLRLERVLLTGNAASRDGGGIFNAGELLVINSTLSGNVATRWGGGVAQTSATAATTLVNATVAKNLADADVGGVFVNDGSALLHNTVVALNTLGASAPEDVGGAFDSDSSFNFIGTVLGSSGLSGGSGLQTGDPKLYDLADLGGPTFTHAIRPASPLTDAGSDAVAQAYGLLVDQRGEGRYRDGTDDVIARVDVGAFEQQFPLNQSPTLTRVDAIGGASEGRAFSIRYDTLLALSDASDPEAQPISFRITAVLAGTLTLSGQSVVPGETIVNPGDTLEWTPPAGIDFASADVARLDAFSVVAWDGLAQSQQGAVAVRVDVRTIASPVNYALLFSGGERSELNYNVYYANLRRTYAILTTQYGLRPEDIYVVYADGRSPAADQRGGLNSDMSFAPVNVFSATRANLRNVLQTLSSRVDGNDHFFFWTFDHGLGATNQPAIEGEEVLNGWSQGSSVPQDVTAQELRVWTQGVRAGDDASSYGVPSGYGGVAARQSTYAFMQCFAGGMLDAMSLGAGVFGAGTGVYGMSSSNHYEASYSDYFASSLADALSLGYSTTTTAFEYAFANDSRARDGGRNGGSWSFNVEHPWADGSGPEGAAEFPIFAIPASQNAAPTLTSVAPIPMDPSATSVTITYDKLVAASDLADPAGRAPIFRISGVDLGTLTRNGTPVDLSNPAQSTIRFGESLTWTKPAGAVAGSTLNALRVKLITDDGFASDERAIPVRLSLAASNGLDARDDATLLRVGSVTQVLELLANDHGVLPSIVRVGVASIGKVEFVRPLDNGQPQVKYTARPDYLGPVSFSYLVTDGTNVDLATVNLSMVNYDPGSQQQSAGGDRYAASEMGTPANWAGLPGEWTPAQRTSAPNWTETRGVDLDDAGNALVDVRRPDDNSDELYIAGGVRASYAWNAGDVEPFWREDASGLTTATNAQLLLLQANNPIEDGRRPMLGVRGTNLSQAGVRGTPAVRYGDRDNAQEEGFSNGSGIWWDVGESTAAWQDAPIDVDPVAVVRDPAQPTSATQFIAVANPATGVRQQLTSSLAVQLYAANRNAPAIATADRTMVLSFNPNQQLGTTNPDNWRSFAQDAPSVDRIVGWGQVTPGGAGVAYRAFWYDGAAMRDLGSLPGMPNSTALAIASGTGSSGPIVVGYATAGSLATSVYGIASGQAFVWQNNTMTALPHLNGSGYSYAADVNDDGVIVGASNGQAVVWRKNAAGQYQVQPLDALVDGLPSGTTLLRAVSVNREGKVLADGFNASAPAGQQTRAYLLNVAGTLAAVPDSVSADNRGTRPFNVLLNDQGSGVTVQSINTAGLLGRISGWDAFGNFVFDPQQAFADLAVGQTRTTSFTYAATNTRGQAQQATVTVTVTGVPALSTLHAAQFAPTATGFEVTFSNDVDASKLSLYDGVDATSDPADLVLLGQNSGASVKGNVLYDAATRKLSFIATGGVLQPDTYTMTLFSRGDSITLLGSGALLDGDGSNTPGGDLVRTFTVAASTSQQRVVSLPDFARSPGQPVDLYEPALNAITAGLPISISDGANVRNVDFTLSYDPALLNVSAVALAAGMPSGWTVTANLATPGSIAVTLSGSAALPAGARELVRLTATVPGAAPRGASHAIRIRNLQVNEGLVAALADAAVHHVAAPGDATGNAAYSGLDAAFVSRVVVNLDSGFDAAPRTDPRIIADVTGNGSLSGLDASDIAMMAAGLNPPTIPPLPPGGTLGGGVGGGLESGASVAAPVFTLDRGTGSLRDLTVQNAAGLYGFELDLAFDTARLDLSNFASPVSGWSITPNVNDAAGTARLVGYGSNSLSSNDLQAIARATFAAPANAPAGTAPITVVASLNEGEIPATAVPGSVTVNAPSTPVTVTATQWLFATEQAVTFTFDQPVDPASLAVGDFTFTLQNGSPTSAAVQSVTYDALTRTAKVKFAPSPRLPDGRYRLTLKANSVTGTSGSTNATATSTEFAFIAGDANADGRVNFDDLLILAANYNQSGRSFPQGDFDYSGNVNFDDLLLLASRYNQTLL